MNTLQILENMPIGAKYFAMVENKVNYPVYADDCPGTNSFYWIQDEDGNWEQVDCDAVCVYAFTEIRNLSDVKQIVELDRQLYNGNY